MDHQFKRGAGVDCAIFAFEWDALYPSTATDIAWVVIYALLMQCVAWGLIAYSISFLPLTLTGLLILSEPVATLLIDYFALDKPINAYQWLGACLTLCAMYLPNLGKDVKH